MHRFQYMLRNYQHIPLTPPIPLSPGSDTVEARYVPKHTRIYCACTWAYIHRSQYVHRNDRYVPLIQFKLYNPDPTQLSQDISPSTQEYSVLGCELVCSGQNMSPEMTVMTPDPIDTSIALIQYNWGKILATTQSRQDIDQSTQEYGVHAC